MSRSSDIVSQLQRRRAERKKPKVNSKLMKVSLDEGQLDGIATAAENKPPPMTLQKTGGRNSMSLFFSIGLHVSLALLLGFIYIKDRITSEDDRIETALIAQDFDLRKRTSLPVRKRPTFEAEQQEIEAPIERDIVTNNNLLTPREGDLTLPSTHGTELNTETPGLREGPRININPRGMRNPVQPTTVGPPKLNRPTQVPTVSPDLSDLANEASNPVFDVPGIDTSDLESSPPKVKKKVDPIYPQNAKRAGKEGTVKLQATIGTDGIPKNIVALTKPGFGFENAAIDALKKWRFVPGKKKGKDAEMTVSIDIQFKLDD